MLSKEQKDNYMKNPRRCPHCGSDSLEMRGDYNGEGDFGDPKKLWGIMRCTDCFQTWIDNYVLVSVEDEDDYPENEFEPLGGEA